MLQKNSAPHIWIVFYIAYYLKDWMQMSTNYFKLSLEFTTFNYSSTYSMFMVAVIWNGFHRLRVSQISTISYSFDAFLKVKGKEVLLKINNI